MFRSLLKSCANLPNHRLSSAFYIGVFAAIVTIVSKFYFIDAWYIKLSIGTGISTLILVWLLHYFLFSYLKSNKLKYTLLITFPLVYAGFLITTFATFTTLSNLTWFQVPLINQIYLQIWNFLGDGYIYAVFSPKIPFILTSLLVIISFGLALNQSHTQPEQD